MNGGHDMGGMQGYGPFQPEPHEPVFHAPWERQALALTPQQAAQASRVAATSSSKTGTPQQPAGGAA